MRSRIVVLAASLAVFAACGKNETPSKNSSSNNTSTNNTSSNNGSNNISVNNVATNSDTPDMGAADGGGPADMAGSDAGVDMGPSLCGNGTVDAPEECDDGAANDDLGNGTCRATCLLPACGDGAVDWRLGETCDDGNVVAADGCSDTCTREALGSCGDGVMDAGEACDDGMRNDDHAPDACRTDCSAAACGDAVADRGEECDDGNARDGDGCSANCTTEAGGACGDGNLDIADGEECDDANTTAGDGCSATCQFEPPGAMCGDGNTDSTEKCDDSNAANGDGCNPTCNLLGQVTTLLPAQQFGVSGAGGLSVDRDRLWVTQDFRIGFVALDAACLANGTCTMTPTAGDGTQGLSDNADGSMAQLGFVESMATDGNTLWFFDQRSIRAMSTTSPYAVTTVAGDPSQSPNDCDVVDGIGAAARFHGTRGLTYYNGALYFLDGCTGLLRQFDPATNEVTTVAGTEWVPSGPAAPMCPSNFGQFSCNAGQPVDGYGSTGAMVSPRYMASDNAGMLYITDTNGETLRTYNTVTGYLGTLAGGTQGYNDGVGRAAQLDRPRGLTSDGTSLYFGEQNQHTVRQVVVPTATVSTLAGQRGCQGDQDGTGGTAQASNCPGNPMGDARFDSVWNVVYHFPSRSLYVRDANGVRRVE